MCRDFENQPVFCCAAQIGILDHPPRGLKVDLQRFITLVRVRVAFVDFGGFFESLFRIQKYVILSFFHSFIHYCHFIYSFIHSFIQFHFISFSFHFISFHFIPFIPNWSNCDPPLNNGLFISEMIHVFLKLRPVFRIVRIRGEANKKITILGWYKLSTFGWFHLYIYLYIIYLGWLTPWLWSMFNLQGCFVDMFFFPCFFQKKNTSPGQLADCSFAHKTVHFVAGLPSRQYSWQVLPMIQG